MKRALGLILIVAVCVMGFLSIRGSMPFMPVFGTSMEPQFHAGNLILIEDIAPSAVKVGDVIVYNVPSMVREHYNYPPVVAHRVVNITTEQGISFRTKGDNVAGEDPFTIRAQDLRGIVSQQIPYLGYPFLFFQSDQGLIFLVVGLVLLALYLYADELRRGKKKAHRGVFAPVIEENRRDNQAAARRMKNIEKGMGNTQEALESFALAMKEYAQHLQSHTSAIQGLSEASQALKQGAAEQNRVLSRLMEVMEQVAPKTDGVMPDAGELDFFQDVPKAVTAR